MRGMNKHIKYIISTPSDAVALFRAALPKWQKEERVFVLPLDGSGRALAEPILVSLFRFLKYNIHNYNNRY